jgi:hypothetical protein
LQGTSPVDIAKATNLKSPGNEKFSFKIQIGGKRYPLQDIRGFSESRAKLAQAVGINASSCHSLAMSSAHYRGHTWIGAVDTELCALGAHLTGTDLRQGDLCTVQMEGMSALGDNANPGTVHVILLAQTMLNLRSSGVDIVDLIS